jgi:hypothetical protein
MLTLGDVSTVTQHPSVIRGERSFGGHVHEIRNESQLSTTETEFLQ